ncbi:MAG: AtpZ/AtpI family protein [Chloroflexi bacterium]|nr:MAG: AtpZ/AtpI family protein [Chloroflexota bacterium]
MRGDDPDKQPFEYILNRNVLFILGQAGCLTLLIAVGSLFLGLFLDDRLGTAPWITIFLFVASAPIAFIAVYLRVRAATKNMRSPHDGSKRS